VLAIADEVWGVNPRVGASRSFSAGRVYAGADLQAAVTAEKITEDVSMAGASSNDTFMSVHRKLIGDDIYFVSNRHISEEQVVITFRVNAKIPEIWHAEDGRIEAASYEVTSEGVRVPLHFDPNEAFFVVFRGETTQSAWTAPPATRSVLAQVDGPWTLHFQSGRGAPASATIDRLLDWTTSGDPGVKYFSGEASYSKVITVPKKWMHSGRRITLDLGIVHELAVLSIDGKTVGTSWHPPYRLDVTAALAPGAHRLDIKVVNLWVNRLIGDKQPGATAVAFAPQSPYRADSPLRTSGLLGPVQIFAEDIGTGELR